MSATRVAITFTSVQQKELKTRLATYHSVVSRDRQIWDVRRQFLFPWNQSSLLDVDSLTNDGHGITPFPCDNRSTSFFSKRKRDTVVQVFFIQLIHLKHQCRLSNTHLIDDDSNVANTSFHEAKLTITNRFLSISSRVVLRYCQFIIFRQRHPPAHRCQLPNGRQLLVVKFTLKFRQTVELQLQVIFTAVKTGCQFYWFTSAPHITRLVCFYLPHSNQAMPRHSVHI